MNSKHLEHELGLTQTAKLLEDDGYTVMKEPSPEQLPFSLAGYVPDLVATRGDENLIVEIKTRGASDEHLARYRKTADLVEQHPGWKFVVKVVAEPSLPAVVAVSPPPELDAIEGYLQRAEGLFHLGSADFAIPYLWNAIIALLRHKAGGDPGALSKLTDRSVVNQVYTMGEISDHERIKLLQWSELRNQLVHNLSAQLDPALASDMAKFADGLLAGLRSQAKGAEQSHSPDA